MKAQPIFGQGNVREEGSHWLSVSDLMAGLMMIFLFIAISYMRFVQIEKERIKSVVVYADETHGKLYDALENEFRTDLPEWKAELDKNPITVRFKEAKIMFDQNSVDIKPRFQEILRDFIPRYVAVLDEFTEYIEEVRIEGHTSSEWRSGSSSTVAYFENMKLSQARTQAVLEFSYQLPGIETGYPWMKKRFAAVGLSSSRLVMREDDDQVEDKKKSRRVEFTVKTNFEQRMITQILDPDQMGLNAP